MIVSFPALQHDPEKWMPVFGKDHAGRGKLECDDEPKITHHALTHVNSANIFLPVMVTPVARSNNKK
jgi:hypothetical protein